MIILYRPTFGGGHQFLVGRSYVLLMSYIVGEHPINSYIYIYNWDKANKHFNALFRQSNQLALLVVTGKTPQQVFEMYNDSLVSKT